MKSKLFDGPLPESKEERRRLKRQGRTLWQIDLPDGAPEYVCDIADDLVYDIDDITIDGKHLILREAVQGPDGISDSDDQGCAVDQPLLQPPAPRRDVCLPAG